MAVLAVKYKVDEMKSVAGTFFIAVVIIAAYRIGLFDLFTMGGATIWALVLVAIMLSIGYKVLGRPNAGTKTKDDENEKDQL